MNLPRETVGANLAMVTEPAEEPVTLAEAKAQLRVTFDDDDALISTLISAARQKAETEIDRRFVTQTLDYKLENFPISATDAQIWVNVPSVIVLPVAPVASVTSVSYVDAAGTTQVLAPNTAYLAKTGTPGAVHPFPVTSIWPYARQQLDAVTIRFVAGYGDAADVPAVIKAAILLLVDHLYVNRSSVTADSLTEMPMGVRYLLGAVAWGKRP